MRAAPTVAKPTFEAVHVLASAWAQAKFRPLPVSPSPSEPVATIADMWQVTVVCSSCSEETEVPVESLDDVEREVCPCGYSYVVVAVAELEPVEIEGGELIELRRPDDLKRAA